MLLHIIKAWRVHSFNGIALEDVPVEGTFKTFLLVVYAGLAKV
jgi:hypothetical protein